MKFHLEVAAKTDVGTVRESNEDNFGFDTRHGIFVLCDGMGGEAAGEVASRLGVQTILDYFRYAGEPAGSQRRSSSEDIRSQELQHAITQANSEIRRVAAQNRDLGGMDATVAAVLVRDSLVSVAHAGDSRVYLFRDGELHQLTNDHSLVMEQVRRGYLTVEEAQHSDLQNVIIRALGAAESVGPDVQEIESQEEDTFMLACDGLTKAVSPDRIRSVLHETKSLCAAVEQLIEDAKQNGSDDNITGILVRLTSQPWYRLGSARHQWQDPF